MDTKQLRYFVSLAQTLSFTQSAEEFYITQPAISRQIYELEQELGVILFFRNRRKVSLTRAGEEYYKYAVSVLELLEDSSNRMRAIASGKDGSISISTTATQQQLVIDVVKVLTRRYPNLHVSITIDAGQAQVYSINQKKCDIYFSFLSLLENSQALDYRPLSTNRFYLYVPSDLAANVSNTDFTTLKDMDFITVTHQSTPTLVKRAFDICRNRGLPSIQRLVYVPTIDDLVLAVRAGLGYTIFPGSMQKNYNFDRVLALPISGDDAIIENAIGWEHIGTNSAIPLFLECVSEVFPTFDSHASNIDYVE